MRSLLPDVATHAVLQSPYEPCRLGSKLGKACLLASQLEEGSLPATLLQGELQGLGALVPVLMPTRWAQTLRLETMKLEMQWLKLTMHVTVMTDEPAAEPWTVTLLKSLAVMPSHTPPLSPVACQQNCWEALLPHL